MEQAHDFHPATLRGLAQHLRDHLDPDGTLADEHDRRRLRELTLTTRSDGSGHLTGELTAGCTVTWQTILDALAAPKPAADGERDARTAAQRRHDAFHDAGQRLLRVGDLPDCGGTPATVLITMTLADLETRTGLATTEHGGATSIDTALQITAEADVIPVTVNDMGGVLAYGRRRRTASPAQRLALAARDGGCSFTGCDSPPAWTQAHHVIPWADGGRTDLDNLTLVCGFHHREFERVGWRCDIYDRVPWWTPPAWIDPTRTPRRNHTHHLARLLPHPPVGPLKINQARGEPVCLRSWPDTVLPDTLLPDPLLPDTVLPDTLLPDPCCPTPCCPTPAARHPAARHPAARPTTDPQRQRGGTLPRPIDGRRKPADLGVASRRPPSLIEKVRRSTSARNAGLGLVASMIAAVLVRRGIVAVLLCQGVLLVLILTQGFSVLNAAEHRQNELRTCHYGAAGSCVGIANLAESP